MQILQLLERLDMKHIVWTMSILDLAAGASNETGMPTAKLSWILELRSANVVDDYGPSIESFS